MEKNERKISLDGCKPDIEYPCAWQYKIIGNDRAKITEAVKLIVLHSEYLLTESSTSSSGRYVSMGLELIVHSEEERLLLYQKLTGHEAVKIVL